MLLMAIFIVQENIGEDSFANHQMAAQTGQLGQWGQRRVVSPRTNLIVSQPSFCRCIVDFSSSLCIYSHSVFDGNSSMLTLSNHTRYLGSSKRACLATLIILFSAL